MAFTREQYTCQCRHASQGQHQRGCRYLRINGQEPRLPHPPPIPSNRLVTGNSIEDFDNDHPSLQYHEDGGVSHLPPHHYRHPHQVLTHLSNDHMNQFMDSGTHHSMNNHGTLRSVAVSASSLSETVSATSDSSVTRRVVDPITQAEIKYAKRQSPCTASTCSYLFVALILIAVGATSGIYFALSSFEGRSLRERVFKSKFVITRGEPYDHRFENPSSDLFKETSVKYEEKLNKLFNTSRLGRSFKKSEVIALEKRKEGSDDVIIHSNLHFNPRSSSEITSADVYIIIADEFSKARHGLFSSISIDQSSIDVTERRDESRQGNRLTFPFYPTTGGSSSSLSSSRQEDRNSKSISSPIASNDPSYFRSGYNYYRNPWEPRTRFPGVLEGLVTEPTPPVRRCQKIDLPFCSAILPYNETSYPNIIGHWNLSSLEESFIAFRQVVDAECYPLAREFVCRLLQPECLPGDVLVYPCRDFCADFKRSCGQWIDRLEDKGKKFFLDKMVKCSEFPRYDGDDGEDEISTTKSTLSVTTARPFLSGSRVIYFDEDVDRKRNTRDYRLEKRRCRSKPGCSNELKMRGREQHVCDGIVDCPDSSDETSCDFCSSSLTSPSSESSSSSLKESPQRFYCGSKQCVENRRVCDGILDCNNGADEENCLRLEPHLLLDPEFVHQSSGVVVSKVRGKTAKVCFENFENTSLPIHRKSYLMDRIGSQVCSAIGFRDAITVETKVDHDRRSLFTEIHEVTRSSGQLILRQTETQCNSRQVLHVSCESLECGRNPLFSPPERRSDQELTSSLKRLYEQFDRPIDILPGSLFSANDGDFPWVAALFKDGQFVCDGTLIDQQWIVTSTACFEDADGYSSSTFRYSKSTSSSSQWKVLLGSVRLTSKSPLFAQEKDVIALLHSPYNDKSTSSSFSSLFSSSSTSSKKTLFSGLSLLKIDSPVNVSDYVRPICLHSSSLSSNEIRKLYATECFTSSWNVRKDRLEFSRSSIMEEKECDDLISSITEPSSSEPSSTTTPTSNLKWKNVNWCLRISKSRSFDSVSMTAPGRGLFCLTSANTFSLVGIEDPLTSSFRSTSEVSRKEVPSLVLSSKHDSAVHLFTRTARHTEWIRQILDSFKRSASVIHETRIEAPYASAFPTLLLSSSSSSETRHETNQAVPSVSAVSDQDSDRKTMLNNINEEGSHKNGSRKSISFYDQDLNWSPDSL